ncbi:Disease resistance protein [Corchorus capsularis]|uniref:Disease resistance protein n=1 Tax=Corchorus capsularis TaxID=210143 RepID=A0A1R3J3D2_COCAP|nr:Disease resistance protein [Corchorus capsularis]
MPFFAALSAIREIVVSKLFDAFLDKLSSYEFLQFATEKQICQAMEKLRKELQEIRAVLADTEERQLKDQCVKIWLSNLQNLAYDIDDILDEFATEMLRQNLMMERRGSSSKKPKLMISDSFNAVMFNRGMMSKINDVTARLKDLEPQKNQLQLRMFGDKKSRRMEPRILRPTSSVEIETHVYGRDQDKEAVLQALLQNDGEANFVIPIVGMGGIGKTTLAQLVYNDARVKNHFDLQAWVCVSDDFDVTRISKQMLESITSDTCNNHNSLTSLQEDLKKTLSEKKFLIVLNDVWNDDYHKWTVLQSPFLKRTPGSKVLVTTRNRTVSATMGATQAHFLEVLSGDDCLAILAQHALGASDFGGHPCLKEVAEEIVRKCNGLPLAAKTLGGLLRTDVDVDAWKDILESDIWKLSESHQCGIIPALQLSYHHLPSQLKRCFGYLSIFPKDYELEEEEIILLWCAEGFLQQAGDKLYIENLGHKYFRDLLSRSLLQISNKDNSDRFVMHDLIHDLAQSVAGEICFRIEGDKQISKHTRHLSYMDVGYESEMDSEQDYTKNFDSICEVKHLRTFLIYHLPINNVLIANLLSNLKCLRVLALREYRITTLPDFIGDLNKHLRYLDLSWTHIQSLPESICTLYNLETLLLRGCSNLKKLPSEMDNLVNLAHLNLIGSHRLEGMPSNFNVLTDLQSLSNFVLGKGKGCQIRELKDLSNLKGQLCISGLENVVEIGDALKAKIRDKSGIDNLQLVWSESFESRNGEAEEKVLDFLQPSERVKELAIMNYGGSVFANWVGNSSFTSLLSLCMKNCRNCLSLPSLGQLPLLGKLWIKGMHSITKVGVEFSGENMRNISFPSLEILEFKDMPVWEDWNFSEVCTEAKKFPRLRNLVIKDCPKLLGGFTTHLPSNLEILAVVNCKNLVISIQSLPRLSYLMIRGCVEVVYKGFEGHSALQVISFSSISKLTCVAECGRLEKASTTLHELTWLKDLQLIYCHNLISLSKSNLLLNVKKLLIGYCYNLRYLLEEGESSNMISNACVIEELRIFNCPSLVLLSSRGELSINLKELRIGNCPRLESIAQEIEHNSSLELIEIHRCVSIKYLCQSLPTTNLKVLCLQDCSQLQALPDGMHNLKHLERLEIKECSSIAYLPEEGLPTSLRELTIEGSNIYKPLIQWGLHRLTCLRSLDIDGGDADAVSFPQEEIGMILPSSLTTLHIRNFTKLQILSSNGFRNLNSLEDLRVYNCQNLKYLPEKNSISSLLFLDIWWCPVLRERCEEDKGAEWPKIAHVPHVRRLSQGVELIKGIIEIHQLGSSVTRNVCRKLTMMHETVIPIGDELLHFSFNADCGDALGLENVDDSHHVEEAEIHDKSNLTSLKLEWTTTDQNQVMNRDKAVQVMNFLRPHSNLKELTVDGYTGAIFPAWEWNHNEVDEQAGNLRCLNMLSMVWVTMYWVGFGF